MGQQHKEFDIDGTRYLVQQYSARKSLVLLGKLVKIVGKPMGILTGLKNGLDAEVDGDLLGNALEAMASQISPEELPGLAEEILEKTLLLEGSKNRPIIFDNDFSGRIGHLFKVLGKVLQFQYGDFLGGLVEVMPMTPAKKEAHRIKAL